VCVRWERRGAGALAGPAPQGRQSLIAAHGLEVGGGMAGGDTGHLAASAAVVSPG
jgi:hypothetical protein